MIFFHSQIHKMLAFTFKGSELSTPILSIFLLWNSYISMHRIFLFWQLMVLWWRRKCFLMVPNWYQNEVRLFSSQQKNKCFYYREHIQSLQSIQPIENIGNENIFEQIFWIKTLALVRLQISVNSIYLENHFWPDYQENYWDMSSVTSIDSRSELVVIYQGWMMNPHTRVSCLAERSHMSTHYQTIKQSSSSSIFSNHNFFT